MTSGHLDERDLATALAASLVAGDGMNDCLRRFLEDIGRSLGSSRLALYDYDERGDCFDLLHFLGFAENARSELHRRIFSPAMRRALDTCDPYDFVDTVPFLAVPLYFQETLEAVLLVELPPATPWYPERIAGVARLASRFLGLFMSSSRLPVNARRELASLDDLARAREVQLAYLPSPHLVTARYELLGHNRSSSLVGGDYYDYFHHPAERVQGVVADACGHGMSAALIMTTFRGLLHAEVPSGEDIEGAFARLNRKLYRGGDRLQYLTGIFFEYHESTGHFFYVNAGHFDPVLVHADGNATMLEGGGPPLGMFPEASHPLLVASPVPGDLLLLFTDGLVELADPAGEFFEVERIVESVRAHRERALPDIATEVLSAATRFRQRDDVADDVTLFMMRFR